MLTWQTAFETGNLGFQVERSADGSAWQQIGFVPARSENEEQPFYTFTDEKALEVFPGSRMLYYRLRQMEWNGGENLSIIVRIQIVGETSDIRVFPNPVSDGALTLERSGISGWAANGTGKYFLNLIFHFIMMFNEKDNHLFACYFIFLCA